MLNKWMNVASIVVLVSCASLAHGQALPTATARGALQVGIGWTYVTPDYAQKNIQGVTGYADFDFLTHFGVEAEYHYIGLITSTDIAENSFFIGPRFLLPRGRFNYYAKAMVGDGDFVNQLPVRRLDGEGTHLAYAAGVGVDYRATSHIVARADFEYQHWSFLGSGLTPTALTVGVAYRFR